MLRFLLHDDRNKNLAVSAERYFLQDLLCIARLRVLPMLNGLRFPLQLFFLDAGGRKEKQSCHLFLSCNYARLNLGGTFESVYLIP